MPNSLFITLGTRDLILNKEKMQQIDPAIDTTTFYHPEKNYLLPRKLGEFLIKGENVKKFIGSLSFPMIQKSLNYLKRDNIQIDQIILFVTDQSLNSEIDTQFKNSDTIHTYQVFKKYLEITDLSLAQKMGQSIILDKNITFLDFQYKFFEELFRSDFIKKFAPDETVYLLNQGGIDAINTALLLNCINTFQYNLKQLTINENSNSCVELEFTNLFLLHRRNDRIKILLNNYDYSSLADMETSNDIRNISRYAQARLSFDFESAKFYLAKISSAHREFQQKHSAWCNKLSEKKSLNLLPELLTNAIIKFKQKAFADFLIRMFRIDEEICRRKAIGYMGLLEFSKKSWRNDIQNYLAVKRNILLENKYKAENIEISKPTRKVFQMLNEHNSDPDMELMLSMDLLSNIRNTSFAAHDFGPISLENITAELSTRNITIENILERISDMEIIKKYENQSCSLENINRYVIGDL